MSVHIGSIRRRDGLEGRESGTVVAVFPTVDDSFRYAVDIEGYGLLQFFAEEKLIVHPAGLGRTP